MQAILTILQVALCSTTLQTSTCQRVLPPVRPSPPRFSRLPGFTQPPSAPRHSPRHYLQSHVTTRLDGIPLSPKTPSPHRYRSPPDHTLPD
ncbi:hypothetical protein F5X68DRAFT_203696 [Plectosphaerella plurivora]|uniref:Secreted protein n=1 Tax=Plectosphaerella plurivora TaxID=936078 RepID=A0A9P8VE16_9PEZI|nr:hypothetical protein F5X68DRAFT_203696 [Plectosphaerella plurivora]